MELKEIELEVRKLDQEERDVVVVIDRRNPRLYQQAPHKHAHHHDHQRGSHHDFEMEPVPVAAQRRQCPRGAVVSLKWVYGVLYVIIDSNLDAFIVEELIEYITVTQLRCLLPLAVGFCLNIIPNIPWTIAILSVWDKNRPVPDQARRRVLAAINADVYKVHDHAHDHGHGHDHEHHDHHGHDEHGHDHNSPKEILVDMALIFLPSLLLSVAASWDTIEKVNDALEIGTLLNTTVIPNIWTNCNALNHTSAALDAPLSALIPISLFSGIIRGLGDFWLHRTYFHESGGNPLKAFKTTMWNNLILRTDHGIFWKIAIGFTKLNIIGIHLALGYFSTASLLDVTHINAYLPHWLSTVIALIPGLFMAIFEAITETFRIDFLLGTPETEDKYARPPFDTSEILLLTKLSLVLAGIIHTVPAALVLADITYQWTSGPGNGALYNLLLLLAYTVFVAPSIFGFYATAISYDFDDIIRGLVCSPLRDDAPIEIFERPDRNCCGFWRRRGDRARLLDAPAAQGAQKINDPAAAEPAAESWCVLM